MAGIFNKSTSAPIPIDFKRELKKRAMFDKMGLRHGNGSFFNDGGRLHGAASSFFDPFTVSDTSIAGLRCVSRAMNGSVSPRVLREIARKAWVINICISNVLRKAKPFFKPSTDRNIRGFVILKKDDELGKAAGQKSAKRKEIEDFIVHTGIYEDSDRDTFVKYADKILRDVLTIDQVSTEIQYNRAGNPIAFFAVDAGTIERVLPNEEHPEFKYAQVINGMAQVAYTDKELIFDFANPQTDIYRSFYGYSPIEQAIDLIASEINTIAYNVGAFTENKLPRGMLLVDGGLDYESTEEMVDYVSEIMSGSPANQWRIPVIPADMGKGEGGNTIKWVQMGGNNRDMEFSNWLDFLVSNVVALFGCSMEELGLHSNKSQAMFERDGKTRIEQSKSNILGDVLSFLQDYVNRILDIAYPEYKLEFVGYEKDDPKAIVDIDKSEIEAYKTLNEKREEKGMKKLDAEWADIPLNPQAVQLFQAAQAQEGTDEQGGEDGSDDSWGDYQGVTTGEDFQNSGMEQTSTTEVPPEELQETENNGGEEMRKSLLGKSKSGMIFSL